jgi:hypothetical protein
VYFSTSLYESKQNRNSKWYYKNKKNQEFSVVIRFTSSSAFENNESSDKSSFVPLAQKKAQKFSLQTKACSYLRTK